MGPRVRLSVLSWLLPSWLATAPGQAECHKRILAFVDVTGSMFEGGQDETPFDKTYESLQELLENRDFFTSADELTLYLFDGSGETEEFTASGPSGLAEVYTKVREVRKRLQKRRAKSSDITILAESVAEQLEASSRSYERIFVILASDFVHLIPDLIAAGEEKSELGHWSSRRPELRTKLENTLDRDNGRQRRRSDFALFVAPPGSEREAEIQQEILVDLRDWLRPEPGVDKELGQLSMTEVAEALKDRFLYPLDTRVVECLSGQSGQPGQCHIQMTNKSCLPITIQDVELRCTDGRSSSYSALESGAVELQPYSGSEGYQAGGRIELRVEDCSTNAYHGYLKSVPPVPMKFLDSDPSEPEILRLKNTIKLDLPKSSATATSPGSFRWFLVNKDQIRVLLDISGSNPIKEDLELVLLADGKAVAARKVGYESFKLPEPERLFSGTAQMPSPKIFEVEFKTRIPDWGRSLETKEFALAYRLGNDPARSGRLDLQQEGPLFTLATQVADVYLLSFLAPVLLLLILLLRYGLRDMMTFLSWGLNIATALGIPVIFREVSLEPEDRWYLVVMGLILAMVVFALLRRGISLYALRRRSKWPEPRGFENRYKRIEEIEKLDRLAMRVTVVGGLGIVLILSLFLIRMPKPQGPPLQADKTIQLEDIPIPEWVESPSERNDPLPRPGRGRT